MNLEDLLCRGAFSGAFDVRVLFKVVVSVFHFCARVSNVLLLGDSLCQVFSTEWRRLTVGSQRRKKLVVLFCS